PTSTQLEIGTPPGSVRSIGRVNVPCVGALTMNCATDLPPGGPYSGVDEGQSPAWHAPDGRYCTMKSTSAYRLAELVTDTVPERVDMLCAPGAMGKPYQAVGKPVAPVVVDPTMWTGLGQVQLDPPQSAAQT